MRGFTLNTVKKIMRYFTLRWYASLALRKFLRIVKLMRETHTVWCVVHHNQNKRCYLREDDGKSKNRERLITLWDTRIYVPILHGNTGN